ncbi:MAG TPA: HD domain-containing phosphohydrolase, partial [Humisphaera sp.]
MPLIVPCQDLTAGMRLAEAFVWKGRTMIPGGKVLTPDDLDVLRRRYPQVVLKVGDPLLDSLVEFEDDSRDREVACTARAKIVATVTEVHQRLSAQSAHGGIDHAKARSVVADVMEFLAANPVSAALLDRNLDAASPLAEHAGTAFYLSMVLGAAVRDYVCRERQRQTQARHLSGDIAMNLLPLGLGAMFMDLGMQPISHVFADGYELTDDDRRAIRDHPRAGADLLPDNLPTGVKMVVRTHHENFDGTGYPGGTAGPALHVFTRIVRIADAFAAATGRRAFRGAKSPARAIWEMSAGPVRRFYDPVLVKV